MTAPATDPTTAPPAAPAPPPDPAPTYTAPATQAELDRIIEGRLARERSKYADYDDVKSKAERLEALEHEMKSDQQKAVDEAIAKERANARTTFGPQLVEQAFRAEGKGVLSDDQLSAVVENFDLMKYLDRDGKVDRDAVAAQVKKLAGANGSGAGAHGTRPISLGQGTQPPVTAKPGDQARAQLEKRFGKKP